MRQITTLLVFLFWANIYCHGISQDVRQMLKQHLLKEHPRILLSDEGLNGYKELAKTDTILKRYVNDVLFKADNLIGVKTVKYELRGPRLLSVSRDVKNRVLTLGLAYRWTHNDKYARELLHVVLAACKFPDWNPSHFLDVAEMTFAVAVAYDWLYHFMDEKTRNTVLQAIIDHGLSKGIKAYEDEQVDYGWWKDVNHNWNQVCNSGLLVGALAVADTMRNMASTIISNAVKYLPLAIDEYNPDGAWMEGPGYWGYATMYTAYGIGALQVAMNGHTFGLTENAGLKNAGYFPIYTTGPTGYYLNFADSRFKNQRKPLACMFWLASTFNNLDFSNDEHKVLADYNAVPEHIVWYVQPCEENIKLPLNKYFESDVQLLTLRSAWTKSATFIGMKAGYNQVNHGHLDLGNFEFDALKQRWAIDLGGDNYNLPGYWDKKPGGKRWSYYRLGSKSHNVLIIDNKNQDATAESHFVKYNLNEKEPFGIIELTSTYPDKAHSIQRGIKLINEGKDILVQDEIRLKDTSKVTWGITTEATIALDGQQALLEKDGKKLSAYILQPETGSFSMHPADQSPPESPNKGIYRLEIELADVNSETIAILFVPQDKGKSGRQGQSEIEIEPLAEW